MQVDRMKRSKITSMALVKVALLCHQHSGLEKIIALRWPCYLNRVNESQVYRLPGILRLIKNDRVLVAGVFVKFDFLGKCCTCLMNFLISTRRTQSHNCNCVVCPNLACKSQVTFTDCNSLSTSRVERLSAYWCESSNSSSVHVQVIQITLRLHRRTRLVVICTSHNPKVRAVDPRDVKRKSTIPFAYDFGRVEHNIGQITRNRNIY
jgi:hypothetical protein